VVRLYWTFHSIASKFIFLSAVQICFKTTFIVYCCMLLNYNNVFFHLFVDFMRCWDFKVFNLQIVVFWGFDSGDYKRCKGTCYLHLQSWSPQSESFMNLVSLLLYNCNSPYNFVTCCLNTWVTVPLPCLCTRWFRYDRDKLWLVYTQIVPVIFELPCILNSWVGSVSFMFKPVGSNDCIT
jgi:hypothetical protein